MTNLQSNPKHAVFMQDLITHLIRVISIKKLVKKQFGKFCTWSTFNEYQNLRIRLLHNCFCQNKGYLHKKSQFSDRTKKHDFCCCKVRVVNIFDKNRRENLKPYLSKLKHFALNTNVTS